MKCSIFENLLTTTKTESFSHFDLGKPKTNSIEISTQGSLGMGKGLYNSWGKTLHLACLQVIPFSHILSTSHFRCGKKKCSFKTSKHLKKCSLDLRLRLFGSSSSFSISSQQGQPASQLPDAGTSHKKWSWSFAG